MDKPSRWSQEDTDHARHRLLYHNQRPTPGFIYSLNLAREAIKGMAENARRGWWNGGYAPFGYRLVELPTDKSPKRKLEIEKSEAAVARRIFDEYLKEGGVNSIRRRLNDEGIRMRSGHRFTTNSLLYMLRNEKYAGDCMFGKHPNPRRAAIDMHFEPIIVRNSHPTILDRQTWQAVQEKLTSRRRDVQHPRVSSSSYLFAGRIRCGLCGSLLVGYSAYGNGGRYRYYVCGTIVRSGPKACAQQKFNADDLERVFFAKLRERLTTRRVIRELITSRNELLKQAQKEQAKLLPKLEEDLHAIDRKRTRLYEAIEENLTLTLEDIGPRLRELAELKTQKELERDELKKRLALQPVKDSDAAIQELVEFYTELFCDETCSGRKRIVRSLATSVKIDDVCALLTYDPSPKTKRIHAAEECDKNETSDGELQKKFCSEGKKLADKDSNLD